MNKEIKSKWIKALKGGDYMQAEDALADGAGGYCCLGVLCEITKIETGGKWVGHGNFAQGEDSMGVGGTLPNFVKEYVGMSSNEGALMTPRKVGGEMYSTLAQLNDNGLTFGEIADIIEAEY